MSNFDLYDVIPEGVFVVNSSYDIVFWNQRMEFWANRPKAETESKSLFDVYPHIKQDKYIKRIENLLNGAPTVLFSSQLNPHFIPLQHSDGKLKIVYTTVSLYSDSSENYFIFCIQDFTNHRNNILEIEELRKQAQRANEYKGEFLATVSHELRTPLNGILGLTELTLESNDLSDENLENLTLVKYSGEKLLNLVSGILDLSKIEAQQLVLESAPFIFPDDVLLNIHSLSLKAYEKHLDIFLDFDTNIPKHLVGDITRLNQVMTNIIGNAIKFTHQGSITIKASQQSISPESINILFEIIDTGIGIDKSNLDTIFESYVQASDSTTREYGGTGLGTTISKEIVELMGGELWIESELNKGSNFQFLIEFPIDQSQIQKTLDVDTSIPTKVLFYSPSLEFISNIEQKLSPYNYHYTSLCEEHKAQELSNSQYDLALIDYSDNDEFIKQSSNARKTIVFKNITDTVSFENSNITVLTKPISHLKLFQTLFLDTPREKAKTANSQYTNTSHRQLSILVVDDNSVNQKLASKLLTKLKHQVEIASGGYEAIDKNKESDFDLILMDISMPDLNGYQATKIIRSFDSKTPIIAMTANSYKKDKANCLSSGMNGYIEKPINFVSVRRTIEAIANHKEILIPYQANKCSEVYTLAKLLTLFDEEKDYALEMIASFISSTDSRLDKLLHAIQKQNSKQVKFEVHSLKGIALVFNAIHFTQILKELQSTQLNNQQKVLSVYDSAVKENNRVKSILEEYKHQIQKK